MIRFIETLIERRKAQAERRKAQAELREKLAFTRPFDAKAVARGMARTMDHHRMLVRR